MKSNAIIRIVLFTLAILILLGILAVGFSLQWLTAVFTDVTETHTQMETNSPAALPNSGSSGGSWADDSKPGSDDSAQQNDYISFPANEIQDISIEWAVGDIHIAPADVDTIQISENYTGNSKPMVYTVKHGELKIEFNNTKVYFGISIDHSKDLTILVPQDWQCDEFELDAASANLEIKGIHFQEIDIDTASGRCSFENCTATSLDIDTASGDITYRGQLQELDCDAATASFTGYLSNTPKRIEMDSASGDITLTLPEGSGFTVSLDGLSSDFQSDFETVIKNGNYIAGDGSCHITMEAMSGDVTIHKG